MIKNLKLPLQIINEEICDADGKSIMLLEKNKEKTPLLPTERNELINLAVELINGANISGKLNENAQLGDKVIYNKQRGYIIGQTSNGDFIVQIQGSSSFAKPSEVKVVNGRINTVDVPYKFDKITQKVLFEQFVKCGIFMGNTPVKVSNCFVQYSEWKSAQPTENVNVLSEGVINILPKENVRVFEDPNDFANPQDYVEGVIIDEASEEALENILINAIDYSTTIGDANGVRIIRGPKSDNPQLETLPKAVLRTMSI